MPTDHQGHLSRMRSARSDARAARSWRMLRMIAMKSSAVSSRVRLQSKEYAGPHVIKRLRRGMDHVNSIHIGFQFVDFVRGLLGQALCLPVSSPAYGQRPILSGLDEFGRIRGAATPGNRAARPRPNDGQTQRIWDCD